ncbi:hypothetical protein [Chondromyces apiculatus]|uniref:Uncharacterized protein n=1 Tax=Chondromyces apiculatus DSM 436 TaxID=1192034 RepID=A0A017SWH8_9BACT|nr:hypothetical protein [Chondromyces apiculatus]EYF01338.1 Hypothetical protein CAP_8380 [Chondromyces apiculatus DSM 436]
MNQLRTIGLDEDLDEVDVELAHTEAATASDLLTATLTPAFTQLREDLVALRSQEVDHHDAVRNAAARAFPIDDELNGITDQVKVRTLALARNDYQDQRYRQYFGDQSPSELKRHVLGEQLEVMRTWVAMLDAHGDPELAEISQRLAPIVERADAVVNAQAVAQQHLDAFEVGARKAFIDQVNGQRKLAFGRLGEIIHATPERRLTSSYTERFFLQNTSARMTSVAALQHQVKVQKAKLARLEKRLEEMMSKQAQAKLAQQEAALEARRRKVAEAEKRAAAATAELESLKAQLEATR